MAARVHECATIIDDGADDGAVFVLVHAESKPTRSVVISCCYVSQQLDRYRNGFRKFEQRARDERVPHIRAYVALAGIPPRGELSIRVVGRNALATTMNETSLERASPMPIV